MYSITYYSTATGTLTLQHAYPTPPHVCPVALVDVNILLSTMQGTDTQVGEWVNVMGYIEDEHRGLRRAKGKGKRNGEGAGVSAVRVQAIMLWSAGSVNLGEYEKAVLGRNKARGESELLG